MSGKVTKSSIVSINHVSGEKKEKEAGLTESPVDARSSKASSTAPRGQGPHINPRNMVLGAVAMLAVSAEAKKCPTPDSLMIRESGFMPVPDPGPHAVFPHVGGMREVFIGERERVLDRNIGDSQRLVEDESWKDFLQTELIKLLTPTIEKFDDKTLQKYKAGFDKSGIFRYSNGERVDTLTPRDAGPESYRPSVFLVTARPNGDIYVFPQKMSEITGHPIRKHSSAVPDLECDGGVAFAGQVAAQRGHILYLDKMSGHYWTTHAQFNDFVNFARAKGIKKDFIAEWDAMRAHMNVKPHNDQWHDKIVERNKELLSSIFKAGLAAGGVGLATWLVMKYLGRDAKVAMPETGEVPVKKAENPAGTAVPGIDNQYGESKPALYPNAEKLFNELTADPEGAFTKTALGKNISRSSKQINKALSELEKEGLLKVIREGSKVTYMATEKAMQQRRSQVAKTTH